MKWPSFCIILYVWCHSHEQLPSFCDSRRSICCQFDAADADGRCCSGRPVDIVQVIKTAQAPTSLQVDGYQQQWQQPGKHYSTDVLP